VVEAFGCPERAGRGAFLKEYTVAIVGATGLVGKEVLNILQERKFPIKRLIPLATEESVGTIVEFREEPLIVQRLEEDVFEAVDFAVFAATIEASEEFAPAAVRAGAIVVDNSAHFRMKSDVPLVIPEINGQQVWEHKGIIANPNCSTIQLLMALYPLDRAFGVEKVVVSTYQSVSGTGKHALQELAEQSISLLSMKEPKCEVYPKRIGFNLLPHIGDFDQNGYSEEERKLRLETAKIMNRDDILISPTCVRVPVFNCHSQSLNITLKSSATRKQVHDALSEFPGVEVWDALSLDGERKEHDEESELYPVPSECTDRDEVFVGRIRLDDTASSGVCFWSVMDNLRKGAALNAVQILEMLT